MEWLIGVGLIAALAAVALIVRGKRSAADAEVEAAKDKYFKRPILTYWGDDNPSFGAMAFCMWVGRSKKDPSMLRLGKKNLLDERVFFFDVDALEERGGVFIHNMSGEVLTEDAWMAAKITSMGWQMRFEKEFAEYDAAKEKPPG